MDDYIFDCLNQSDEEDDHISYFPASDPDLDGDDFGIFSKTCELKDTSESESPKT